MANCPKKYNTIREPAIRFAFFEAPLIEIIEKSACTSGHIPDVIQYNASMIGILSKPADLGNSVAQRMSLGVK